MISGIAPVYGLTEIELKIFNIEHSIEIFVVENNHFHNDILIGLDNICSFQITS